MLIEFNNFSNNYELSPIYEYKFSCLINDFFISYFQTKIHSQKEKKNNRNYSTFVVINI
jgi:hypothetical protein